MHPAGVTILSMGLALAAWAQREVDDSTFVQWRTADVRFTVFDIRGDDPVDSIVYPAYYTVDPLRWIDSMGCRRRVLIYCHHGAGASDVAGRLVARGYPGDSVFFSGYSVITSSRFPAADTLPLHMWSTSGRASSSMTPHELQALIHSDREYRVVDVRSVIESEAGMIPGACVIPWPDPFTSRLDRFGPRETIVLYCRSGSRAGQARQYMIDNGFTSEHIINFGGFAAWEAAGLQVTAKGEDACMCSDAATSARAGLGPPHVSPIERALVRRGRLTPGDFGNEITAVSLHDLRGRRVLPRRGRRVHGLYVVKTKTAPGEERIVRIPLH